MWKLQVIFENLDTLPASMTELLVNYEYISINYDN